MSRRVRIIRRLFIRVAPSRTAPRARLMVFKSVCGSRLAAAAICLVGIREWAVKQDHPAHIPRGLGKVAPACDNLWEVSWIGVQLLFSWLLAVTMKWRLAMRV